ncbi:MAG: ASCH domain-containing protein [Pyramidobacter sp.]|uniref:ASCH domain-containing protein n=1 Tax=Pyramidobacter sp. TaxID=1943581 RepID=UPI0025F4E10E|nr:ASCH domain-containing protein [Pyramidobacter sp.]MCI7403953.1 ASCH domain-containing protein [Pyramidobacter sp.]
MTVAIKGLSVRQPWANQIVCGTKTVEWRSWATKYRGPLLICSTAQPDSRFRAMCKDYPEYNGVACGIVTLADCVPFTRRICGARCA